MTNPALLGSGIGMMAAGILPILYWRRTRRVKLTPFVLGAALWVAAILPKIVMDMAVGGPINAWAGSTLGYLGTLIFISLLVGLRTGAFESGFTYLTFLKTRLRSATYDEAVGFGLAFGGTEALILGLGSFLNVLMFLLNPGLVEQIPVAQREAVMAALDAPSVMVFAPIIERAFTILVHLFATILVYVAVVCHDSRFFWASFLYRTGIDGMVPGFGVLLAGSSNPLLMTYLVELAIAAYGSLGLLGVRSLRKRIHGSWKNRTQ